MPFRRMRIAGDQALQVSKCIPVVAGRSPGGFGDVAANDIEIDKPRQGAVSDILKLTPESMTWQHWQIGMFALQGLHARQFIHTDRSFALFGSFNCSGIDLTALNDFHFPLLVGYLRQPVPETVRLQPPFLSR